MASHLSDAFFAFILSGAGRHFHGENIGRFRIEEAPLLEHTEEVQQLGYVVGAVGIAEAGIEISIDVTVAAYNRVFDTELRKKRYPQCTQS